MPVTPAARGAARSNVGDGDQWEGLTERLRAYGANYREFSRRFAAWLGLHSTDAEALLEILAAEEQGSPLSPARLSGRIGKSNPATSAVLNRLEAAGHVVRTRENGDRRVVTLRSGSDVQALADRFFAPLGRDVGALVRGYPAADIARFEQFLDDLLVVMSDRLAAHSDAFADGGTDGEQGGAFRG
ncbi:MarR family transcriptional regulator [Gordonia sp. PDNC005]|uniref:MarR family winged helix-turn-helix transcriptional regulator n=1 Tax=unclassified Gordonia (in: high G+C Gram-positive bacteria) TaxID=2657482 RepID=UPI0019664DBF|nr:MarR family transcriptional regulator [Gordonia sp. PDNC005]QRY62013.1 MarR family transcriptional regulator [Gordonia sp. PDNC005]